MLPTLFAPRITQSEFDEMVQVASQAVIYGRKDEPTPWTHPLMRQPLREALDKAFGHDRFWMAQTLKSIRQINPNSIDGVRAVIDQHDASKRGNYPSNDTCTQGWRPHEVGKWLSKLADYEGGYVFDANSYVVDTRPKHDRWCFEQRLPSPRATPQFLKGPAAIGKQHCVTNVSLYYGFDDGNASSEASAREHARYAIHWLLQQCCGPAFATLKPRKNTFAENENVRLQLWCESWHPKDHISCYRLELTKPNR